MCIRALYFLFPPPLRAGLNFTFPIKTLRVADVSLRSLLYRASYCCGRSLAYGRPTLRRSPSCCPPISVPANAGSSFCYLFARWVQRCGWGKAGDCPPLQMGWISHRPIHFHPTADSEHAARAILLYIREAGVWIFFIVILGPSCHCPLRAVDPANFVELRACTRVQVSIGSSIVVASPAAHYFQVGSLPPYLVLFKVLIG